MSNFKKTIFQGNIYDFCLPYNKELQSVLSIKNIKSEIEQSFKVKNLIFRLAKFDDISRITNFQKELFFPNFGDLETTYELFRLIRFGYIILIESFEKEILGTYLTLQYNSEKKDASGIRVSVSPKISGNNYAVKLAKYGMALAYENGCQNYNGLVAQDNYQSISNILNHLSYYCNFYHTNLPELGSNLEVSTPLTLEAIYSEGIDFNKIRNFINDAEANTDYFLIESNDNRRIEEVYSQTEFKIIAFIKKGTLDEKNYFFAIKPATF